MTTLQKTLVTATVAVLAGAGIYETRQASQLRGQVQTLQQQQAPLEEQIRQLHQERDVITSRLTALHEENARLNRNTSELLKLRGEVGLLRNKAAELRRLQHQSNKLKENTSQLTQNPEPDTAQPTHFPRESWAFAGYSTPEAALQTWTWALSRGDKQTMLNSLTPEARKEWEQMLDGQNDQQIQADSTNMLSRISGYQITDRGGASESELWLAISMTPSNPADAKAKPMKMTLKRVGNEWRVAGPSAH